MSRMSDGVISGAGDSIGHIHGTTELPTIGGMAVCGIVGTAPGGARSGSLYAVRSPVFTLDEAALLAFTLDWGAYAGGGDGFASQVSLHDGTTGTLVRHLRRGPYVGSMNGVVTLQPGAYFLSGSFPVPGFTTDSEQEIVLLVRPLRTSEVVASYTRTRTDDVTTIYDTSSGAVDTTVVWDELDRYDSLPAGGAAAYIHSDQENATVLLVASDASVAVGTRGRASNAISWSEVDPDLPWGLVDSAVTWSEAVTNDAID